MTNSTEATRPGERPGAHETHKQTEEACNCKQASTALPDWLAARLANPPTHGEGVHSWLFGISRQLWAHHGESEQVAMLAQATANCGRKVPLREIVSAVRAAARCAWRPTNVTNCNTRLPTVGSLGKEQGCPKKDTPAPTWPTRNRERIEAILSHPITLVDLWELSPTYFEEPSTAAIVDMLYPGNPLLCVGRYIPGGNGATEHWTKSKEEWLATLQIARLENVCNCAHLENRYKSNAFGDWELIVPNPMTKTWGTTATGKQSQHTLEATGPRHYLVIEFDQGTADQHSTILVHLSQYGPLVMVVSSGNKSLHGWFACAGIPEAKLHKFMTYAVSLGADPTIWTRSQFVRLPDGLRGDGKRQSVFYFNPQNRLSPDLANVSRQEVKQ